VASRAIFNVSTSSHAFLAPSDESIRMQAGAQELYATFSKAGAAQQFRDHCAKITMDASRTTDTQNKPAPYMMHGVPYMCDFFAWSADILPIGPDIAGTLDTPDPNLSHLFARNVMDSPRAAGVLDADLVQMTYDNKARLRAPVWFEGRPQSDDLS
jgi:hypothetical protein